MQPEKSGVRWLEMPYTSPSAPLAQSNPSESLFHLHTHSPPSHVPLRSFSLTHTHPQRPQLPRSYSSQSYLRRHRRSPSYSKATLPPVGDLSEDRTSLSMSVDPHASLRQSPPPRTNAIIPTGAVISPPESSSNSSDEEASPTDVRGVDPIDAAIRSLEARKKTEEENGLTGEPQQRKEAVAEVPALTPEARKISHSRSTSDESGLAALISDSAETSSIDSEREEDGEQGAKPPPMVRKKSGELVRPALRSKRRPSSMPGTPIFSKNVHFDAQLEHIRHFLQLDKPLAVSANTSPVETYNDEPEYPFSKVVVEWEIKLPNFPSSSPPSSSSSSSTHSRKHLPVRLERVFLSPDHKNLVGVVSVANLAFQKTVIARFTVDYWKTVSEVTAEYNQDIRRKQAHDGYDRFDFNIQLSDITDLEKKTLFICIRYSVGGQEYWDNNGGMNYQVEFSKTEKTISSGEREPLHAPQSVTSRDHGRLALPRSRHNPSIVARPRSMPPANFDEFRSLSSTSFPASLDGHATEPDFHLTAADSHDWLEAPKPRENRAPQAFSARYNFGLSLSAAKSSGATEDRTTLSAKAKSLSRESTVTAHAHTSQPSAIVSSKPHLESPIYKELVDKYCFFGSAKRSESASPLHSSSTSGTTSPDEMSRGEKTLAPESPAGSPSLHAGSYNNGSPVIFNGLYRGHHLRRSPSGFLSESQPAVILG